MLERLRIQTWYILIYRGLYTYLFDTDRPVRVNKEVNLLQYMMCYLETTILRLYFILAAYQVSVKNLLDNRNAFATLMKAQRDTT